MKKVFAFLLTAVLVISASVCVAFAAPSIEVEGVISGATVTDANGEAVEIAIEKIDKKVEKPFYDALQGLKSETKDKTLKIVGHYNVDIKGDPEYPIDIALDVLGISKSSKVYVLIQKGKEVVSVIPTVKKGKILFDYDEAFDKLAIVVDGKTATKVENENNVLSPQTADATPYVAGFMVIIALAFVLAPKKAKA